ncbi:MAG TPA: 2,3,4,5-tetrahydropyridine-2,6-dicarboxylate N-succinyltransferase, partial [Phycicoccus sp.]
MTRSAWGHGLVTTTDAGTVLDAWFPSPALGEPGGAGELAAPDGLEALVGEDPVRRVRRDVRLVTVDLDSPP